MDMEERWGLVTGDLKGAFEHRPIQTLRRFYILMRRTTPLNPLNQ